MVVNQHFGRGKAGLYYHLNPDLTLREMTVGSGFEQNHSELFATKVLDHKLSAAEIRELECIREAGHGSACTARDSRKTN